MTKNQNSYSIELSEDINIVESYGRIEVTESEKRAAILYALQTKTLTEVSEMCGITIGKIIDCLNKI